ncbi:MAG: PQQ-binding-like beta-propeller repeat protein, partial [Candidatus Hermodarchaeota archaeon]
SPSIGEDGTIYLAGSCMYAINSDGTLKWKFDPPGGIFDFTCPAIDKNGTLYASTCSSKYTYMYAINPDGTVKWKISIGNTYSPPTIGDNGLIYFTHKASDKSYITALNTDGILKWGRYISDESMVSSPAVGIDGTIYCGSHDCYLYAIKSNGSIKWKFNTGGRVHGSPTLNSDGTVFIGSENGLHALYQNNGSMKWHINLGEIWGGLALDDDGTVYVGVSSGRFYAINPDGTIKWTYYAPGNIWFTSPALSADGIIYFGTLSTGGGTAKLIALNTDGTERWTWKDSNYDYDNFQSAPAIGPDGTVYIASSHWLSGGYFYLHAFGMLESNAPNAPIITGQENGEPWKEYEYTFKAIDPNDDDLYYYVDWGDGTEEEWIGPYSSGEEVKISHIWTGPIVYTIIAKAKDTGGFFGPWDSFEINMPRDKSISSSPLLRFLERYPLLQTLLMRLGLQ